jgi:hypothetical protein
MTDEPDMTAPMTRGEVYEAFETWVKDLITRVDEANAALRTELTAEIARVWKALRADLMVELEQARTEVVAKLGTAMNITELRLMFEISRATSASAEQLKTELSADLAQHVEVVIDTNRSELRIVDDQYRTLPVRVEKLEDVVFKPKRKRRAKG